MHWQDAVCIVAIASVVYTATRPQPTPMPSMPTAEVFTLHNTRSMSTAEAEGRRVADGSPGREGGREGGRGHGTTNHERVDSHSASRSPKIKRRQIKLRQEK